MNGREPEEVSLRAALPGLARISVLASVRLAEWTAGAYIRAWRRLLIAAAAGEAPTDVLQRTSEEVLDYLRELLGVRLDGDDPYAPMRATDDMPDEEEIPEAEVVAEEPATVERLREQGADLLRRSADIEPDKETHPAYERILAELAPDEARIVRLLVLEGAQPSVDVRSGGPIGIIKDELIAPGLNMIGMEAGVRHPERVQRYLNNLYRLGLIWFSREQLEDQARYQVLEAQPEVAEAMDEAGRGRTVRRSIHLTPFGEDFARVCLPLETSSRRRR
jgi:Abortive infection alpha